MKRLAKALRVVLLLALVPAAQACAAAVAAGAGAGAAIAYSERGVSSKVEGSVEQVFERSRAVFQEMGIAETSQDGNSEGTERELKGTRGDLEVTVDIKRDNAALTSVEVFAQESTVEWDRDYARDVLQRIIARS